MVDELLAEAYFLHRHPGWTPRDMDDAPQEMIEAMRTIYDTESAVRARASSSDRPTRRTVRR